MQEDWKKSLLAKDIKVGLAHQAPIAQMNLPDLYATKFRILQRLENNRLAYTFLKVRKMKLVGEEDGTRRSPEMDASESTLHAYPKAADKKTGINEEKRSRKTSLAKLDLPPLTPHSRRKVNWDLCLEEVAHRAMLMAEENKFKLAELSNLSRRARKEISKKENQSKGLKEYRKLVSARFAYEVKAEFNAASLKLQGQRREVQGVHNIQLTEPDPNPGSQARMADGLRQLVAQVRLAEQVSDPSAHSSADDKKDFEAVRDQSIKEIQKVLNKWNKPSVKNFLKTSSLFLNVDKTVPPTPFELNRQNATDFHFPNGTHAAPDRSVFGESMERTGQVTPLELSQSTASLDTRAFALGSHSFFQQLMKEKEKDREKEKEKEIKDKDMQKIVKADNIDEALVLYLNQNNPNDSFRKIFKTSIEVFPNFPKSFDEIPVARLPLHRDREPYEARNFFGDHATAQYVENGLGQFVDEVLAKMQE